MVTFKNIDVGESLADAELDSYAREHSRLELRVKLWNDKVATLHFIDVLGIIDFGTWEISGLVSIENDDFYMQCLRLHYENDVPQRHGYSLFAMLDNSDNPTIKIVAKDARITLK